MELIKKDIGSTLLTCNKDSVYNSTWWGLQMWILLRNQKQRLKIHQRRRKKPKTRRKRRKTRWILLGITEMLRTNQLSYWFIIVFSINIASFWAFGLPLSDPGVGRPDLGSQSVGWVKFHRKSGKEAKSYPTIYPSHHGDYPTIYPTFPVFRGDSELDPIQADDLILFPLQGW